MKKNFWSLIWYSFWRLQSLLGGIIAVALAVILWLFAPNTKIPLAISLPIGILCVMLIIILGHAAYEALNMSSRILPKVLFGKRISTQSQRERVLCLLEPSDLFSHDAIVSFYYIDDENFELLIGLGNVVNIQEDSKIQVALTDTVNGHEEIVTKIAQNDSGVLKKIKVKPNVPRTYLETLQGG